MHCANVQWRIWGWQNLKSGDPPAPLRRRVHGPKKFFRDPVVLYAVTVYRVEQGNILVRERKVEDAEVFLDPRGILGLWQARVAFFDGPAN
jgi:hypothetical protein